MWNVQRSIVAGVVPGLLFAGVVAGPAHAAETPPPVATVSARSAPPVAASAPLSRDAEQQHAALWNEAIEAFSAEDYAHASRVFEALYAQFRDLDALFNLAQSYAKQGRCDLAVPRARTHLAEQPGTDRNAEAWQTLETACPELRADWIPAPVPAPAPAANAEPLPAGEPRASTWPGSIVPHNIVPNNVVPNGVVPNASRGASGETADPGSNSSLRPASIGGWVLVGTGAAAAVTSVVFAVAGANTQSQVNGLAQGTDFNEVSRLDTRGKQQNVAAIGFAAAAAVTGGIGAFLLWSIPSSTAHSEIGVGFLPGLAAASFRGRF